MFSFITKMSTPKTLKQSSIFLIINKKIDYASLPFDLVSLIELYKLSPEDFVVEVVRKGEWEIFSETRSHRLLGLKEMVKLEKWEELENEIGKLEKQEKEIGICSFVQKIKKILTKVAAKHGKFSDLIKSWVKKMNRDRSVWTNRYIRVQDAVKGGNIEILKCFLLKIKKYEINTIYQDFGLARQTALSNNNYEIYELLNKAEYYQYNDVSSFTRERDIFFGMILGGNCKEVKKYIQKYGIDDIKLMLHNASDINTVISHSLKKLKWKMVQICLEFKLYSCKELISYILFNDKQRNFPDEFNEYVERMMSSYFKDFEKMTIYGEESDIFPKSSEGCQGEDLSEIGEMMDTFYVWKINNALKIGDDKEIWKSSTELETFYGGKFTSSNISHAIKYNNLKYIKQWLADDDASYELMKPLCNCKNYDLKQIIVTSLNLKCCKHSIEKFLFELVKRENFESFCSLFGVFEFQPHTLENIGDVDVLYKQALVYGNLDIAKYIHKYHQEKSMINLDGISGNFFRFLTPPDDDVEDNIPVRDGVPVENEEIDHLWQIYNEQLQELWTPAKITPTKE